MSTIDINRIDQHAKKLQEMELETITEGITLDYSICMGSNGSRQATGTFTNSKGDICAMSAALAFVKAFVEK